jgi:hypothetical protein
MRGQAASPAHNDEVEHEVEDEVEKKVGPSAGAFD